ncbi:MAG: zinc-binding dehydrogenase [Proteobacteria bacterium]|nr:zinc-binding dehydrogenase [Pseudomonadota bacterium]
MTMPRTTKAAILVEQRQPLVVDEIELPSQLDCGQVLVRVLYSGICGSQLGEIAGVKGPDKFLPHLMGHEGSGEVLATGPGVRHVKQGDRVVLHWRKGRGIEAMPAMYKWRGQRLNAGWVTTFNEHAVISENRLTPLPLDFDMELAPLLGCAVTTGFGAMMNTARLQIGESVVVLGAGGVGLNVIQAAALTTAHPIVAVDIFDNRLELARTLGATHTINSRDLDLKDGLGPAIRAIIGPAGADVVVDNTGNTALIALAYALTQAQGRTILVGVPRAQDDITIHSLPLHFGKVLSGTHGGDGDPSIDIPRYARLEQQGLLRLAPLVTERYVLDEINEAINRMKNGAAVGRCIIGMP